MFNFIKKAPNSSPKWFVRYMACQHPLGFLQSFLLVDSRAIYSKHNLDPITFLLKPFQWFSTTLQMESKFLNTACIAWPLTCISYCFLFSLPPCICIPVSFPVKLFPSSFPGWPLFIHWTLCPFILQVSTYGLLPQGLPLWTRSGHTLPAPVMPGSSPS